ncbi:MAG: hypothetical protein K2F69_03175 [Bacteroidaceae bacterium]|nr:hypothetical protein [Bacteroidaceae bacterium]MDE6159085.1 hypothetical protein [Bacteroidaceae bacterium]
MSIHFSIFAIMKKKTLIAVISFLSTTIGAAEPWKFKAENREMNLTIEADLYEESIEVPGLEMFGPLNGYVSGRGIYGVWAITGVKKVNDNEAVVHFSNDLGSETQAVRLVWENDSTLLLEQKGGTTFKRVENKKLVKLPAKIIFNKR